MERRWLTYAPARGHEPACRINVAGSTWRTSAPLKVLPVGPGAGWVGPSSRDKRRRVVETSGARSTPTFPFFSETGVSLTSHPHWAPAQHRRLLSRPQIFDMLRTAPGFIRGGGLRRLLVLQQMLLVSATIAPGARPGALDLRRAILHIPPSASKALACDGCVVLRQALQPEAARRESQTGRLRG